MQMHFNFVPSLVNDGAFDGSVTLRIPSYEEKSALLDLLDFDSMEFDEDSKKKKKVSGAAVKGMLKIGAKSKDFVVSVNLTRKEDGFKFTEWEHLNHDSDGHTIISEIASKLLSKMQLGKK